MSQSHGESNLPLLDQQQTLSLFSLQSNLLKIWTEKKVDKYYQTALLAYLDNLPEPEAKQQMIREHERMLQNKSQYNKIKQYMTHREEVIAMTDEMLKDQEQIEDACQSIDELRKINLKLCQVIFGMKETLQARGLNANSICQGYNQLFKRMGTDNANISSSYLRKYIAFSKGYDPFFLVPYERIQKNGIDEEMPKCVSKLFKMNISYVYRLIKIKNQIVKCLSCPCNDQQNKIERDSKVKVKPKKFRESAVVAEQSEEEEVQYKNKMSIQQNRNRQQYPRNKQANSQPQAKQPPVIIKAREYEAKSKSSAKVPVKLPKIETKSVEKHEPRGESGSRLTIKKKNGLTEIKPIKFEEKNKNFKTKVDESSEDQIDDYRKKIIARRLKVKPKPTQPLSPSKKNDDSSKTAKLPKKNSLDLKASDKKKQKEQLSYRSSTHRNISPISHIGQQHGKKTMNLKDQVSEQSNARGNSNDEDDEQDYEDQIRRNMKNRKKPVQNKDRDKDLSIGMRPIGKSGSKEIWQYQNDSPQQQINESPNPRQSYDRRPHQQQQEHHSSHQPQYRMPHHVPHDIYSCEQCSHLYGLPPPRSTQPHPHSPRHSALQPLRGYHEPSPRKQYPYETSNYPMHPYPQEREMHSSNVQSRRPYPDQSRYNNVALEPDYQNNYDNYDNRNRREQPYYSQSQRESYQPQYLPNIRQQEEQRPVYETRQVQPSSRQYQQEYGRGSPQRIQPAQQIQYQNNNNSKSNNNSRDPNYNNNQPPHKQQAQYSSQLQSRPQTQQVQQPQIRSPSQMQQQPQFQQQLQQQQQQQQPQAQQQSSRQQTLPHQQQQPQLSPGRSQPPPSRQPSQNSTIRNNVQPNNNNNIINNNNNNSPINNIPNINNNQPKQTQSQSQPSSPNRPNNTASSSQPQSNNNTSNNINKGPNNNNNMSNSNVSNGNQNMNNSPNKREIQMKPGQISLMDLFSFISSSNIPQETRAQFETQNWQDNIRNKHSYLTKFFLNSELAAFGISTPRGDGDYSILYWGTVFNDQIVEFLFKKYLEYLQKFTSLNRIYIANSANTVKQQYEGLQFVKMGNQYIKDRSYFEKKELGYTPFLSIQCSNICFQQKDNDPQHSMFYSQEIQQFSLQNSITCPQIAFANSQAQSPSAVLPKTIKFHKEIPSVLQINKLLEKYEADTYATSEQIDTGLVQMSVIKSALTLKKSEFYVRDGFFMTKGINIHENNATGTMVYRVDLNEDGMFIYFGKKFNKIQQFAGMCNPVSKGNQKNLAFKMFTKQLYGRLRNPEFQSKGCYGNWDIDFLWQDQLKGVVIKDMPEPKSVFGPENFYVSICKANTILYAFQVNSNDFVF